MDKKYLNYLINYKYYNFLKYLEEFQKKIYFNKIK